jgi:hypothetical protein
MAKRSQAGDVRVEPKASKDVACPRSLASMLLNLKNDWLLLQPPGQAGRSPAETATPAGRDCLPVIDRRSGDCKECCRQQVPLQDTAQQLSTHAPAWPKASETVAAKYPTNSTVEQSTAADLSFISFARSYITVRW